MFEKLKALKSKVNSKLLAGATALSVMMVSTVPAFAAEGDPTVTFQASDMNGLISAITTVINPAAIISVLATVFAAGAVFVFMWFAIRKATSVIFGSMKKGRLSA